MATKNKQTLADSISKEDNKKINGLFKYIDNSYFGKNWEI